MMASSGEADRVWGGRTLHRGGAAAAVLRLELPLSFWGGVGPDGTVVDAHHPQQGARVTGRVVVMTSGRGSSSSSSVLAELLRSGAGPSAIVLTEPDAMIALGALVADELYGLATPVVQLAPDDHAQLSNGLVVQVAAEERGAVVTAVAVHG